MALRHYYEYSAKVIAQMKTDRYHGFPAWFTNLIILDARASDNGSYISYTRGGYIQYNHPGTILVGKSKCHRRVCYEVGGTIHKGRERQRKLVIRHHFANPRRPKC